MTNHIDIPRSWKYRGDKPWPRWWNLHGWYLLATLYAFS